MATQTVQMIGPPGATTPTLKLFTVDTDTLVDSQTATPGSNDTSLYEAAFTDAPAARYRVVLFDGATPTASDHVTLTLTTATFPVEGLTDLIPASFNTQWASVYAVQITGITATEESAAGRHSMAAVVMLSTNSAISGTDLLAKKPSDDSTFATYPITTDASADNLTGIA